MAIWGKIIGGCCGFLLGGPFGMLIGIGIGHLFDRGVSQQYWHYGAAHQAQAQQAFFNATFLVMGYIAKVDGRVSEAEIQAARAVMDRMGLNETQRLQAMELFAQGKQPEFNVDQTLAQLKQACHQNKILLRLFVELQMQIAQADGMLSQQKQSALQAICQRLGFAPLNFVFAEDLFGFKTYQQQNYQQYQNYQGTRRQQVSLQDAYLLLGISASVSNAEVKRAYRKLMSQHHPDKLIAKGLPEEMLKLATEKTQNIKAAYESICAARGM